MHPYAGKAFFATARQLYLNVSPRLAMGNKRWFFIGVVIILNGCTIGSWWTWMWPKASFYFLFLLLIEFLWSITYSILKFPYCLKGLPYAGDDL